MIQLSQLWGLLALLSLPLIVLLYALRPKRETFVISTNKLWREALRERQSGLGLQKLLRNLSLVIFLLSALVLSLGIAGLSFTTVSTDRNDVVLILDVSASMKAKGSSWPTRFDDAKAQAEKIIRGLDESGRLLLMTSGRRATIRTAFESDRPALGRALDRIEVTDEAGTPRAALLLALSLLHHREQGQVYFLTDAAFDDVGDLDTTRVTYRLAEGSDRNVAITRFDFRPEVGSELRHQVLVSVRNFSSDSITTELSIELDEQLLLRKTVELGPLNTQTLVLPVQGQIAGAATASIDIDDDLLQDNEAFAVVEEDEPMHVLIISPGNFYLESVFVALPNVTVTWLDSVPVDFTELVERHEVTVIDSVQTPELPAGNYLLINTVPPGLPFTANGEEVQPNIETISAGSIVQDFDLAGLRINRIRKIEHTRESSGLQRLIWSQETDLALALIENDLRVVLLGFDLTDSNFPLQASFPLFLGETLAWLHPRLDRHSRTQVAAGEPVTILLPNESSTLSVQPPTGQSLNYELHGDVFQFQETGQAGIYSYDTESIVRRFAVNLTDEQESDIRPRAVLPAEPDAVSVARATGRINVPLWPYLVLITVLLLMLEWALWCWRGISA